LPAAGVVGWRAAQTVLAPVTDGLTAAGLPRRLPRANLVPGSAGERPAAPARAAQAAELARRRLAGFQRGSRRGRDVASLAVSTPEPAESRPEPAISRREPAAPAPAARPAEPAS
jgi:hypothetical protein